MGNYSRFIRPGFVRMDALGSDETLLVSAYHSADNKRWVVVTTNLSSSPVQIHLDAPQGSLPAKASLYETSENNDLSLSTTGSAQDAWTLAPLSVTTIVLE